MVVFHVQLIMVKFSQNELGHTSVSVPMQNLSNGSECAPFDSSVGRAEDCRWKTVVILRSLVQLRLEGDVFHLCIKSLEKCVVNPFQHCGLPFLICSHKEKLFHAGWYIKWLASMLDLIEARQTKKTFLVVLW